MKLYGAIDLHSTNNVTVVINEQDQVVYQKRLPNDLSLIAQQLSSYRRSLQGIVVESTYNWYWLVDGLMSGTWGQGQAFYSRQSFAIRVLCFLHSSSSAMRSEYREINELTVAMSRPKHLATSLSLYPSRRIRT